MKLVCPSCESGFLVDTTAIGPTGRKVRCGRCGYGWLAMPVEIIPDEFPEPHRDQAAADRDRAAAFDEDQAAFEEDSADDTLRRAAGLDGSRGRSRSARRMPRRERARGASLGGWLLFAVCTAALAAVVVLGRQQIMAWAPESAPLYRLAGLADKRPVPPLPTIQLRLREVTSGRRQVNGMQELVIAGEIFNPTDQPQDVPPLVATLMDPTGIELKRWVFAAETEILPPGGHVAFQTSTPDPPGRGNLNLNFVLQRP